MGHFTKLTFRSNLAVLGLSLALISCAFTSSIMGSRLPRYTQRNNINDISTQTLGTTPRVGVCYGRVADNLPPPAEVVELLKSKNVDRVHIYDTNPEVMKAFSGSGISLMVTLENQLVQAFAQSSSEAAQWVTTNIVPYAQSIKYISIGNEVFTSSPEVAQYVYDAMNNVYSALQAVGLSDSIKVSTAHAFNVVMGYPPSTGRFMETYLPDMTKILSFLSSTRSPFMVNIYPYFTYIQNKGVVSIDYATFGDAATPVVDTNNGLTYHNLFDAQFDTVVAALASAGYPDLQIIVTETGWPSDGDNQDAATVSLAQKFNNNLASHVAQGSPRRPDNLIDTYIFALFNEDQKPAGVEQHWGLFQPDETPLYDFNF